ncbi:MAG: homoserine dehydrogenase [Nitrospirales bacterium]|nr:MAG: homoserine dehydrogenase [Nitrospirales bacterium]
MKSKITVGMIGLGTVGCGVAKVLYGNAALIAKRVGAPIELVRIADLDITTDRGLAIPDGVLTTNAQSVLEDPAIDIVVELIGGYDPAKRFILKAIAKGQSVVTANKALLAVHGEEIFHAAASGGVDLGFEASVGGGIPIIKALTEGLVANDVTSMFGIMNGTSNYILTRMTEDGNSFETVLQQARDEGYAEADPTFDVEGVDAAHKLAILVNLAFGTTVNIKDIHTEGISRLSTVDFEFAREFGYTIKLLSIAKCVDHEIEARVHPTLVPSTSPMAQVGGVYNAIHIVGDAVGDVVLYGQGAGSLATASAVVSDIVDIARNRLKNISARVPVASYHWDCRAPIRLRPIEEISSMYYLRFMVLDQPGVLSHISSTLGEQNISISSVLQKGRQHGQAVPLVIMTHRSSERAVQAAIQTITGMPFVSEAPMLLRIEGADA